MVMHTLFSFSDDSFTRQSKETDKNSRSFTSEIYKDQYLPATKINLAAAASFPHWSTQCRWTPTPSRTSWHQGSAGTGAMANGAKDFAVHPPAQTMAATLLTPSSTTLLVSQISAKPVSGTVASTPAVQSADKFWGFSFHHQPARCSMAMKFNFAARFQFSTSLDDARDNNTGGDAYDCKHGDVGTCTKALTSSAPSADNAYFGRKHVDTGNYMGVSVFSYISTQLGIAWSLVCRC